MERKFFYTYNDEDGALFSCNCSCPFDAEELRSEIQSIAGASLEQDGSLVYFLVSDTDVDDAVGELEDMHEISSVEG